MKETQFIQQNKQNWQLLEERLQARGSQQKKTTSKDGAALLLKVTDDLSYAQTFYKRRSIRLYLNDLSAKVFAQIYTTRIKKPKAFQKFWLEELPDTFYRFRHALLTSALLFSIAVGIGIFSVIYYPDFAEIILGRSYISMTEENIANGDPMAVYKKEDALGMFITIFQNNLMVSVLTFIGGIFLGLGTVGILFRNGIMLGTFQFYFLRHDLLFESFLTIWQHGTTEICSIIIAGGAGLTVGKSILFPGTLPRGISIRLGVANGLKILIGVAPVILLAAFIESYLTRHNDIGVAAQLTIIILSLVFMIGYYVWLPAKRGKRFTEADYKEQKPPESKRETFSYSQIKKWGEIIATSIQWLQQHGSALLKWNLWISIVLTGVVFTFYGNFFESLQAFNKSGGANVFETLTALFQVATSKLQGLLYTLNLATFPWFFPAYVLGFGLFQFKIGHVFSNVINGAKSHPTIPQILLPMFLWIVALLPVFWWSDFYIVALVVLMPLIGIVTFVQQHEKLNYAASVKKSLNYALSYPGQFLLIVAVTGLLTSLLVFLTQSPLLWIAIELTNDFIGFTETTAIRAIEFGIVVLAYFTVLIGIGLCGVCFLFYYCSVKEIKEANDLQSRIQQITLKKSTYGIQKSF